MTTDDSALERLAEDPRYRRLVRRRSSLALVLTGLMLAAYFGFILLVAFAKPFLARSLWGGATSIGIPIGLGVIVFAILLTWVYVRQANREYDREVAAIVTEHGA